MFYIVNQFLYYHKINGYLNHNLFSMRKTSFDHNQAKSNLSKAQLFHFSVRHGFLDPLHPKTWGVLFYVRAKGIDTSVLRRTLHSSPGIRWPLPLMEDNPRLYSDAFQQPPLTGSFRRRHLIHPGFRRHLHQIGHNESQGLCRHSIPGESYDEHTGVSRILSSR